MSLKNCSRITLSPGLTTRYLDTGGPSEPLVLLHGIAASIEQWGEILTPLSQQFRVLALDLPGFGHADKPKNASYKAAFFVAALRDFLKQVGIEKAHFLGNSMGASLLVRYSAHHAETMDRVVLTNPGGFGRRIHPFLRVPTIPFLGPVMSRPNRAVTAFAAKLCLCDKSLATPEMIDEADALSRLPGAHRAFYKTLQGLATPFGVKDRTSFEKEAKMFNRPVLVVWGRQDQIFSVKQANTAMGWLPNARLCVIDECGHYPQIEKPRELVSMTIEHLTLSQAA